MCVLPEEQVVVAAGMALCLSLVQIRSGWASDPGVKEAQRASSQHRGVRPVSCPGLQRPFHGMVVHASRGRH